MVIPPICYLLIGVNALLPVGSGVLSCDQNMCECIIIRIMIL